MAVSNPQTKPEFSFPWRATGIAALVALSAMVGLLLGLHASVSPNVILPGVQVAGIPVGRMQPTEAQSMLAERLKPKIAGPVHLRWDDDSEFVYPADIGISADVEQMVQRAMQVGREGNLLKQMVDRYRIRRKGYDIPLRVKGNGKLDAFLQGFRRKIDRPAKNASLSVDAANQVHIIPGQSGLVVNMEKLRHELLEATMQYDRDLMVPVQRQEPDITADQLRSWGITNVVAQFDTSFNTTDANRTHNLKVAAQALNGAVIPPGKTFSFNKQVGPRAPSTGYKEAHVVVNGELENGIGGGVCQVSTTLFNAVLLAGLQIESRQPHSIPSTYVPLGRDATVAYDYIDFRFTNSTKDYLYVKAWVEGNKVRVMLLGAKKAEAAKIVSKVEEVVPYPVTELKDPTLPAGKRVVEREGGKGYKVSLWRVTGSKNGENWQMIGRSTYKPRPRVMRVGTGAYSQTGVGGARSSASAVVVSRSSQG